MKQLWILIKKDLSLSFGISKKNFNVKKILLGLFLLAIFGLYGYLFVNLVVENFQVFLDLGLEETFLMQGFYPYMILLVLFGFSSIASSIYFSNDVRILLPLPVKRSSILASKIISTSMWNLVYALLITMPMVIRYGSYFKKSIFFYLIAILGLIMVTLISLSIISLIIIFIMKYVNRLSFGKKLIQFISMALGIGIALGFQFLPSTIDENAESLLEISTSMLEKVYYIFPQLKLLSKALLESSVLKALGYLALLIGLSCLVIYLVSSIGSKWMVQGVIAEKTSTGKKKKIKDKSFKTTSASISIMKKDLLNIVKTPVYLINTLGVGILFPLIMTVSIVATSNDNEIPISELWASVKEILGDRLIVLPIVMLVAMAISLFLGSASNTSTSSLSREGKNIWLVQSLPISSIDQVKGRLFAAFISQIIGITPSLLIISFSVELDLLEILVLFATCIPIIFYSANLGLLFDIRNPKLKWDNPARAVKQNFNVFVFTMFNIVLAVLLGYASFKLAGHFNYQATEMIMIGICVLLLFLMAGILIYQFNIKYFNRKLVTYEYDH